MTKGVTSLTLPIAMQALLPVVLPCQLGAGDPGYGEIRLGATGTGGHAWWWEWKAEGTRWWTDYRITQRYGSVRSTAFSGERIDAVWIACPEHENPGGYTVAWGKYEFTFHCAGLGVNRSFTLDLSDANWALRQPPYPYPVDLYITWDQGAQKFRYCSTGGWSDLPAPAKIWELWGVSSPRQDVFQPTPPLNFTCTNAGQSGQHPHFVWERPQAPEGVRCCRRTHHP